MGLKIRTHTSHGPETLPSITERKSLRSLKRWSQRPMPLFVACVNLQWKPPQNLKREEISGPE